MKKLIAVLLVTVISITDICASTAAINAKVESQFSAAFPGATQVNYKTIGSLITVKFILNNKSMEAFYNPSGEQVAVSKVIDYAHLPDESKKFISSNYQNYTVTEVIEMNHTEEGLTYYISMINGNQQLILTTDATGNVSVFKKW